MDIGIIADSGCDLRLEEAKKVGVTIVPLTLTLGEENFIDDDTLELEDFRKQMYAFEGPMKSACPSPGAFLEAFRTKRKGFCVTISEVLSGTYNSAVLAAGMAQEEGVEVEVLNTKSASAGQTLVVYKLKDLMESGLGMDEIRRSILEFIDRMKTYFVLDNMDMLIKNGRMNKVTGKIITALGVRPIMGGDAGGNIALYSYARSTKQLIDRMTHFIKESGRKVEGERLIIAHNNNLELASKLKEAIASAHPFKEILLVATGGISSMYSADKGIVLSF